MDAFTSRKSRPARLIAAAGLALISISTYAAADKYRDPVAPLDEPMEFDIPRLPADQAVRLFNKTTGLQFAFERCWGTTVGPLKGTYTPRAAWKELLSPLCLSVVALDETTVIATSLGVRDQEFDIPRTTRSDALKIISRAIGFSIGLGPDDNYDELAMVGPIAGTMTTNEALRMALEGSGLTIRWVARDFLSIEPREVALQKAALDDAECPCNVDLDIVPPPSEQVLVVESTYRT